MKLSNSWIEKTTPPAKKAAGREELNALSGQVISRYRRLLDEGADPNEWAFAWSEVRGTVTPRAGGDPISVDVKQIVVYHKQPDGRWMISRFINNRNE